MTSHMANTISASIPIQTGKHKLSLYYIAAAVVSLLLIWLALGIGFGEWSSPSHLDDTIWQLRYPRVVTALLVGMALSVSGAALQALFENPLADPSLIGTSGGAALGVVLVLALGFGGIGIPLAAFTGSVLVCLFILACHRFLGGGQMGLLILGFVISAFCAAVVSLILFMSDDMVLRSATNWLSGSMAEAGFVPLRYSIISMVLGLAILLPLGRQLDGLMLGEAAAKSLGIKVGVVRCLVVIASGIINRGSGVFSRRHWFYWHDGAKPAGYSVWRRTYASHDLVWLAWGDIITRH